MENLVEVEYNKAEHFKKLMDKALEASKLFNEIARGKKVEEYSDVELLEAINVQTEYVALEEVLEWVANFGIDLVEEIDACADCIYVLPQLQIFVEEAKKRDLQGINTKRVSLVITLGNLVLSNLIEDKQGTYGVVEEALNRVIDNNMSKFTTNKEEALKWKSPKGENLSVGSRVIDGIEYFFLVNENGKIRKRKGFKNVVLDDLLERL